MARRILKFSTVLLTSALSMSCATAIFKVKPVTELPAMPAEARSADAGGVSIRIAPVLSDEQAQELFEANLPVGGVLPVRIEMNFQSGVPVELKRARFSVHDNQNRTWKMLTMKQAVSRIMKANGITLYNPHFKKQFERELGAYGIDLKTPLDSSQSQRRGFLFFQTPDKRPVDYNLKLTLVIERLPQPASIPLN